MTSNIQLYFLGTGTSVGVPQIGCTCPVCLSDNPKNKRLRSSILVEYGTTKVLVDSSPDLRQQALREGLSRIDAVIYTHGHLDHVAGFDDLRAFCWNLPGKLPLYASPDTIKTLMSMYPWAFSPENTYQGYVRPDPHAVEGPFRVGDLLITPVPVEHGKVETYGYLIEGGGVRIGYACDVRVVPPASMKLWQDLDVLVLDALRYSNHHTHMSVDVALGVIDQLKPRQAYLTHMSHEIDYDGVLPLLPAGVLPAHDGLRVKIPVKRAD